MKRSLTLLSTIGICLVLGACGGGGGGGSGSTDPGGGGGTQPPDKTVIAAASDNLFPLNANGLAVYATSAGEGSVLMRVSGTQTIANGAVATIVRRQDLSTGTDRSRAYVVSSSGVRQYSVAGADAIERAFDGTELMRWPAHAGDTYVQLDTTVDSGRDFDGDGRSDSVTLHAEVTAVGVDSMTLPVGFFNNAFHLQQVLKQTALPSSGAAPVQVVTTTDTWYVPGIGIVRNVVAQQGASLNTSTTEALTQYRVGALSGGATAAPTIQTTTPSGTVPPSAQAGAVFNEDMDEASFTAGVFSLADSGGRQVAGSVLVKGKTVSFVPTQPLLTGAYTATISTAALDLFGNHLAAARSWTFTVDSTAPGVLSTWPVADAINVDLTTTISIALSEAPSSASVNAATVKISESGMPVPASLQINGNGINIQPTGGLQRGKHYVVDVSGITDSVGNPLAQSLHFGFDTTPGRFASAERLFPATANGSIAALAVATGDINGDGIPDVVYTDWGSSGGYPMAVYVRRGRADGTLDDPVQVGTAPLDGSPSGGYCDLNALAIGDVTGDGRADVVVGSMTCGVLVLQQNGAGALEVGQFISTPMHVLRIADVNGDGRLDLVGVHNDLALAVVWRQTSTGQLVLDQTPSLGNFGGRDVEIGDIDGDGRADLVVSVFNPDSSPNIAILHQQADGTFGAPTYLSTGPSRGSTGIALGDLNGDGRLDIVTGTGGNSPTWLAVFYQAADGSFPAVTQVPTLDNPWAVRVADIDNDGKADIVVAHNGWSNVGIYLQQAGGTLGREELYLAQTAAVQLQVLAISDLNRDGLRDIIASGSILRQVPLSGSGALGAAARHAQAVRRPNSH